ncbi:MAG: hypothetical protein RSE13_13140 [Planktothrix sp. GU0601_MAG3]|nr:MAG: hypothetical protein RSE13_13140 [Planktothrix sp. GU0601_MAG3]
MSHNLIQAGVIVPSQWPLARVWLEVATLLNIAPRNIERLEFWQHQIWVKIERKKAVFVSYRRLPLWKETGLDAIKNSGNRPDLDQLGEMLSLEVKQYPTQYDSSVLEAWRFRLGAKIPTIQTRSPTSSPRRRTSQTHAGASTSGSTVARRLENRFALLQYL